jgi:hypothetical protein
MVTTHSAGQPAHRNGPAPSIEELFRDSAPVLSEDDLARPGIFADGEVEELIADLRRMRRADLS